MKTVGESKIPPDTTPQSNEPVTNAAGVQCRPVKASPQLADPEGSRQGKYEEEEEKKGGRREGPGGLYIAGPGILPSGGERVLIWSRGLPLAVSRRALRHGSRGGGMNYVEDPRPFRIRER